MYKPNDKQERKNETKYPKCYIFDRVQLCGK